MNLQPAAPEFDSGPARSPLATCRPEDTTALRPFQEGLCTNSSQIDLDAFPDEAALAAAHPEFAKLSYWECILEPGQMASPSVAPPDHLARKHKVALICSSHAVVHPSKVVALCALPGSQLLRLVLVEVT